MLSRREVGYIITLIGGVIATTTSVSSSLQGGVGVSGIKNNN